MLMDLEKRNSFVTSVDGRRTLATTCLLCLSDVVDLPIRQYSE